ncbi:DUF3048 domain-containing protein [Candidatus Saccharibacteria bacterium]|nr:DUF3048 domain-containing protein [Candidatus Saccharibacteria bacterium]
MKKLSDIRPRKKTSIEEKVAPPKPSQPRKLLAHPDGKRRPSGLAKQNWFKKHRLLLIVFATLLVAAAVAVCLSLYFLSNKQTNTDQLSEPKKAEPVRYYSPLTGRETTEEKSKRPISAVMIENSPEARPQSGLREAGAVFEAIAEGGITRFVALFQEADVDLIGPVRSARPYFLEWAAAFDPALAHVGGSDQALQMLRSGRYGLNIDEIKPTIWRVKDRRAPHNAYTSTAELLKYQENHGKTSSDFTAWERLETAEKYDCECLEDEVCDCEAPTKQIFLNISSNLYNVTYDWDETTNTYKRSQGGRPHFSRDADRVETQIAPDVVIAIMVNQSLAADRLHNQIVTSGSGKAYIFQGGRKVEGTWSKASAPEQIKFLDADGKELKLNRGQIWITAVPSGRGVTWK